MGTSGKFNTVYAEQNTSRGEQEQDRPSEQLKNSTFVYKGTTLPHIVVKRQIALQDACFITFQLDKSIDKGKAWQLHRRTLLEPASPSQIRAHERHLRKAGPLRALSAYARDKNVLKLVSLGLLELHCVTNCHRCKTSICSSSGSSNRSGRLWNVSSSVWCYGSIDICVVAAAFICRLHTHILLAVWRFAGVVALPAFIRFTCPSSALSCLLHAPRSTAVPPVVCARPASCFLIVWPACSEDACATVAHACSTASAWSGPTSMRPATAQALSSASAVSGQRRSGMQP
ncbi:hypothetical protein COO60DRAFT_554018 [Scenedesmus sp. NREL 46B-D3]|nr:hypothetical protein COO60DRAFT_554018 [Scenedesmus sp. NREL 46B-D3]